MPGREGPDSQPRGAFHGMLLSGVAHPASTSPLNRTIIRMAGKYDKFFIISKVELEMRVALPAPKSCLR